MDALDQSTQIRLAQAIQEAIALPAFVNAKEQAKDWPENIRNAKPAGVVESHILSKLHDVPLFNNGNIHINHFNNGSIGFSPAKAIGNLVSEEPTRNDVIGWLNKVLTTKETKYKHFMALTGITTTCERSLKSGVQLIPFHELPGTYYRRHFEEHMKQWWPFRRFSKNSVVLVTPTLTVDPFIIPDVTRHESQLDPFQWINRLDDVRLALTACITSGPLCVASWGQFDDQDFRPDRLQGHMFLLKILDFMPNQFMPDVEITEDCLDTINAFDSLPEGKLRARLRLSLSRLNQAMHRRNGGDAPLDLAIALESLLLDDPGEHRYRVSLRSALLLPKEERRIARKIIGALYKMRNDLIHEGKLKKEKYVKTTPAEITKQSIDICCKILKKLINQKSLPDWNLLEMGLS